MGQGSLTGAPGLDKPPWKALSLTDCRLKTQAVGIITKLLQLIKKKDERKALKQLTTTYALYPRVVSEDEPGYGTVGSPHLWLQQGEVRRSIGFDSLCCQKSIPP